MENAIITTMCMITDPVSGKVLVQNRIKNWKGIAFPGGHTEQDESITDSVIREVLEETGLCIHHPRLCGIKHWYERESNQRYFVFLYQTDSFTGTVRDCDEGTHFWTDPATLSALSLADGFAYMLEVFQNDTLSEDFIIKDENDSWNHILK